MRPILDSLIVLALSPLLLAEVLWVVTRVTRYPEAAGPREGALGQGPPLRVLVVGDSSSVGVGVATMDLALPGHVARALARDHSVSWRVIGANGATTAGLLQRLKAAQPDPCDLVVVALGVNDVKNGVPIARWRAAYRDLLEYLDAQCGAPRVIASGLPPIRRFTLLPQPLRWVLGRRAEAFDAALRALVAPRANARHIPIDVSLDLSLLADDKFHPGPAIYALWAEEVRRAYLEP